MTIEQQYTDEELIRRNKIRLKTHGVGAGRWWEYKDKKDTFTVASTKELAIQRANEVLRRRSLISE